MYSKLNDLAESDMYPFHMPGHKRNLESTPLKGAFRCDITEIDGFDNLHHEEGIILEAERRAARLYGSETAYFLVGGSTSGVLSAVSAAVPLNGRILAARGSHNSFYHAVYLRQLTAEYLPVKMIQKYGIYDGYLADEVQRALAEQEELPGAVFITSPTYEGKCSDVEGIAKVCHNYEIPLIVDAAHGAHFGFGNDVPMSAVKSGADLVICSLHKTLPSMTQTALLHVQGNLVDRKRLKRFLRIYQSSSPSYVLMSSMDLCMKEMEVHGKEFIENLVNYRKKLEEGTAGCRNLAVAGLSELEDPAKALIYLTSGDMTGQQLYDILREEYSLLLEMAGEKYALAIITGWDSREGINRLIKALNDVDKRIGRHGNCEDGNAEAATKTGEFCPSDEEKQNDYLCRNYTYELPKFREKISDAWDGEKEIVPLERAEGRISGDFIGLYPPGIPLIVPGEEFDRKLTDKMKQYLDLGMNLQGTIAINENDSDIPLGDEENKGIINMDTRGVLCVKQR